MQIQISIQRPILTLAAIVAIGVFALSTVQTKKSTPLHAQAMGGDNTAATVAKASQDIQREQTKQAVLGQKKEIYEYQLKLLEEQAVASKNAQDMANVSEARKTLLAIIKDKTASEKLLTDALNALWDAQGTEIDTSMSGQIDFELVQAPVPLTQGISAYFHDNDYKAHFGFDHLADDIRAAQGTPIQAPADGVVVQAVDNGLGYSYLVLSHADGKYQTVYGHVSKMLVRAGDTVLAGNTVALSGGAIGAPGSGPYTTGPHLHFAMKRRGADGKYRLLDPLPYLLNATDRILNDQIESGG